MLIKTTYRNIFKVNTISYINPLYILYVESYNDFEGTNALTKITMTNNKIILSDASTVDIAKRINKYKESK